MAGDADRRAERCVADALPRLAQRVEEAAGDLHELLLIVHGLGEHGELVATEAGEDLGLAQRALDALGGLAQHPVAHLVTLGVVHLLEAVEVDEQHAHRRVVPGRPGARRGDQLVERRPVPQPGEVVVRGLVAEELLEAPLRGDVVEVEDHPPLPVVGSGERRDRQPSGAVGVEQPDLGGERPLAAFGEADHQFPRAGDLVRVEDLADGGALELGGWPPQEVGDRGAHRLDDPVVREHADHVGGVADQGLEVLGAFAELPFGRPGRLAGLAEHLQCERQAEHGDEGDEVADLGVDERGRPADLHRDLADDDRHRRPGDVRLPHAGPWHDAVDLRGAHHEADPEDRAPPGRVDHERGGEGRGGGPDLGGPALLGPTVVHEVRGEVRGSGDRQDHHVGEHREVGDVAEVPQRHDPEERGRTEGQQAP